VDEPKITDLRNRNQTAWRAAFSLLYPIAYKTAKSVRINLNDADAEEVAGQALSELVDCIDKIDSIDGLKALTVTISRRRSISKLRQLTASSRGRGLTDSIDESKDVEGFSEIQVSDNAPTPNEDLEKADLVNSVRDFINTLEGNVRDVVACIYIEGLSYKESAEKLGLTTSNVGVYLSRGLLRLKREFDQKPDLMKYFGELVR
jgi:RNA polymerase sigma factor (sigma-70 family)